MIRTIAALLLVLPGAFLAAQKKVYETPLAAADDPDFATQGEYVGPKRAMQVIAMGQGEFDAVIYAGGLPGAGWDGAPPRRLSIGEDEVLDLADANEMKRVDRKSPTLGLMPPTGAVVLFDGTKETMHEHWQKGRITDDGLLMQGVTSKETFQDYKLHLEFRTPYAPEARGQGRGNSGLYHQGRYETQVLDSFGLEGKMNETGGIYSIRAPDLNMCLPPLSWQTYDVDFTAAKFENGKKTQDALITVRLNGVIVQQDVKLTHKTTAAPVNEGPEPGPIYLQDHGSPVRFRNIWVKPRDISREARRPVIPGFERFYASGEQDSSHGGQLLIGELGCVACHQASSQLISTKQAPVLDSVGSRIRPDHLLEFISDPHGTKPGTTMPDVLGQMSDDEKATAAKAIASYLVSTGDIIDKHGHPVAARRGKEAFHSIGCTACHAPQDGTKVSQTTTIPFGKLQEKYSLDSLADFLTQPHKVRPSGRMPSFGLNNEDASDIACYLLREVILGDNAVNMKAKFFEGDWKKIPDFDSMKPYMETESYGFDLLAGGRKEKFGVRYDTYFIVPKKATYKFYLASDDGARAIVDGKEVVDYDGIHPAGTREGKLELSEGIHELRVDYFEQGGEEVLRLEIEGGGIRRTPIEAIATLDKSGKAPEPLIETVFNADPRLIDQGRNLFTSAGCASCHLLKHENKPLQSTLVAKPLSDLNLSGGCLAEDVPSKLPNYDLTSIQRESIRSAITSINTGDQTNDDSQLIHITMARMNCYACHVRGSVGGVELSRNHVFKTTMQEMGDEGRLPPPLSGVGDKLRESYLKQVIEKGANERPYMLVNMPAFQERNLPGFVDAVVRSDQLTQANIEVADGSEAKVKSSGRLLVGNKGLSCVKCHVFGNKGASGIRAIDMQQMPNRLREDWFHRYLIDPQKYRPGTRMPASFPEGKSVVTGLYQGSPSPQIDAMWKYLSDGKDAREPIGIGQQMIELIASDKPLIYRNFIQGLSPRGIAIGYPEQGNVAWDANKMSLSLLWKGAFIDAGRHWTGRGQGNQDPLGDEVLGFEKTVSIAVLDDIDAAWPTEDARDIGYRFAGYALNKQGQPAFKYKLGSILVSDQPIPVIDDQKTVTFRRELMLSGSATDTGVVFRCGAGKKIESLGSDWYRIDDQYEVHVPAAAKVFNVGSNQELRMPVDLSTGSSSIVQEIRW